jgi:hypothetical protein
VDPDLIKQIREHGLLLGSRYTFHRGQEISYKHFRDLIDGYFAGLLEDFPMDPITISMLTAIRGDLLENLQNMWDGVKERRTEIEELLK